MVGRTTTVKAAMTRLFERGDVNSAVRIRDELGEIVRKAFNGYVGLFHAYLERLRQLDPQAPGVLIIRCNAHGAQIDIWPYWHPDRTEGGNRVLAFSIEIKGPGWELDATIYLEAAREASSWLLLAAPVGGCTNRDAALQGLTQLSRSELTFTYEG